MLPEHVSHYVTFQPRLSCNYPGCETKNRSLGLCNKHYARLYRWHAENQTPMPTNPQQYIPSDSPTCTVCNGTVLRKGFCKTHYMAWYKRHTGRIKGVGRVPSFSINKRDAVVVSSSPKEVEEFVPADLWDFVKKELKIRG